jgi:hypothetical protein
MVSARQVIGEGVMKRLPVLLSLALAAAGPIAARAQFLPDEIARRPVQEELLRTAEIVRYEEIGEGVTKPFKLYLKKDGVELKAAWKNPKGMQLGYLEGWQYEIAAYALDKLIGLNMIPPAVEREFQGKPGALVLWAENKYSLLKVLEDGIPQPEEARDRIDKMKYLTRAWDSLIGNDDRTQQNVLYTADWRTIIFDHSRAFREGGEFSERLMYGRDGIKKFASGDPILFRRLPRWFVDKIKPLTFENIRAAVGSTLTDKEIKAVLVRRDLLFREIAQMVQEQGETAVLY